MKYYFDTSSLVKIYHRESGTTDVLSIYNNSENQIQISELGRVEFISTIHRKYKERELSSETLEVLFHRSSGSENRWWVGQKSTGDNSPETGEAAAECQRVCPASQLLLNLSLIDHDDYE